MYVYVHVEQVAICKHQSASKWAKRVSKALKFGLTSILLLPKGVWNSSTREANAISITSITPTLKAGPTATVDASKIPIQRALLLTPGCTTSLASTKYQSARVRECLS